MRGFSALVIIIFTVMGESAASPSRALTTLERAYQREYAFLLAEKRSLAKQLKERKPHWEKRLQQARRTMKDLERKVMNLEMDNRKLSSGLIEMEQDWNHIGEEKEGLESMIAQGEITLLQAGLIRSKMISGKNHQEQKLQKLFTLGIQGLSGFSSVTDFEGEFYLVDGTLKKGQITRVGQIARYVHRGSEQAGKILVPAGEGMYRVWRKKAKIATIEKGKIPPIADIYIYENSLKAVDVKKGKTWRETLDAGGMIAWVIVALGFIVLVMVFIRVVLLRMASGGRAELVRIHQFLEAGDSDNALQVAKEQKSSIARVITRILQNIRLSREKLEDVISESILSELGPIDRFGTIILIIAAISPLLGLLGTVTGMIATFDTITSHGTGDPKLLSGGISEALITTKLGLIVAIPTLLAGNLLSGWGSKIKGQMEREALRVMNFLEKHCQTTL